MLRKSRLQKFSLVKERDSRKKSAPEIDDKKEFKKSNQRGKNT